MRPRLRPLISDAAVKRAEKSRARMQDLIAELTYLPCPNCGRQSLIPDPMITTGIVIYCERSVCGWRPFDSLAAMKRAAGLS